MLRPALPIALNWRVIIFVFIVLVTQPAVTRTARCQESQPAGAGQVRQQVESAEAELITLERERVLREAAAAVASGRVEELKAELAKAEERARADQESATAARTSVEQLQTRISELRASLPQHEAADLLVAAATRTSGRLQALTDARAKLQAQAADLRKSAVEWRSKVADADQQISLLTSQRPELEKKAAESQTALDAAVAALTAAQTEDQTAKTAVEQLTASLQTAEAQVVSAQASLQRLANSIASLDRSLTTLREASKLTGIDATAAIQGLEKAIADFGPVKVTVESLMAQAVTMRDEQSALLTAARAQLDKTTAAVAAAMTAADPLRTAAEAAKAAVAASLEQQKSHESARQVAARWQTVVTARLTSLEPSVQKLSAEIGIVSDEALVAGKAAEAALEPLGRFVSFSRSVAPIFARRCVACHNTRSAGGRLNLDSFSGLLKGGESGSAVDPHKGAGSLLITMMQDGSMPKDADPATPEEIAVVKHWIDVGAPLDAGIGTTTDLFDVMPELAQPLPPSEYRVPIPVTAVAFSPDGSQLASSGYHEVLVWNTLDGTLVRRLTNVAERIYDLEYSTDGQFLAVAAGTPGQLGELKLFNAADGQIVRTLVRARDAVYSANFSPDGSQVVCGGADRSISVVRVADGAVLHRIEDHADWVMDVTFSPNGQKLVSSSRDKTCKVFDAVSGNPLITFSGHGEPTYSAAFLADSQTVVSGGSDRKLRVWNSADAKEVRAIAGFGGDIFRLQVLPDDIVFSASGDRNLHQHKAADGSELRQLAGHADWVYTLSAHVGSKRVASGSYDGEIRIWNSEDGTMTTSFIAIPGTPRARTVASTQE